MLIFVCVLWQCWQLQILLSPNKCLMCGFEQQLCASTPAKALADACVKACRNAACMRVVCGGGLILQRPPGVCSYQLWALSAGIHAREGGFGIGAEVIKGREGLEMLVHSVLCKALPNSAGARESVRWVAAAEEGKHL